jgi:dihydrofolate reductase
MDVSLWIQLKAMQLVQNEDIFIIGGGEIYTLALPFTDKSNSRVHETLMRCIFPESMRNSGKL